MDYITKPIHQAKLLARVNTHLTIRNLRKDLEEQKRQGYKPIRIGVGLQTGTLTLGIIGEAGRMESTVISDAVNLASRIEGLTKIYGASILISQNTLFDLEQPSQYHFRFLDRVQVKGRQEPVSVFEIFSGDSEEMIALPGLQFSGLKGQFDRDLVTVNPVLLMKFPLSRVPLEIRLQLWPNQIFQPHHRVDHLAP